MQQDKIEILIFRWSNKSGISWAMRHHCGTGWLHHFYAQIIIFKVSNWFGNKRIRFRKAKKNEADKKKQKQGTSKMMLKKAKKEMNV